MALPDSGSAELIALGLVGGLAFVMRWVFKPSRPRRGHEPVNATDARELGLLAVVTTVDRADAPRRRAQLDGAGIRSSASRRSDGRIDVLVFSADVTRAQKVLGT